MQDRIGSEAVLIQFIPRQIHARITAACRHDGDGPAQLGFVPVAEMCRRGSHASKPVLFPGFREGSNQPNGAAVPT
jgi:hypothetical protein